MNILHLQPYQYAHIKDKTENIVFMIEGPLTYVVKSHEEVALKDTDMIILPPNSFIKIENPVTRKDGKIQYEIINDRVSKLAKLRFGDEEIRSSNDYTEPFPLYPGEKKVDDIKKARIIPENQALRLEAVRNFYDVYSKKDRFVGDEWVLPGPLNYIDRIESNVVEVIDAKIITTNRALKLRAKKDFIDRSNTERICGEEWLVRTVGPYIQSAEEEVLGLEDPIILSDTLAVTLEATSNYTDVYGIERRVGQKWLLTNDLTSIHIKDVYEKVVKVNKKIILNRWQYCFVKNPFIEGKNQYGIVVVKKGETSFFLQPDEELIDDKIYDKYILSKDEALLVVCKEAFKDDNGEHIPGERWLVRGPRSYIPSVEELVLEKRTRICLTDSEGIYVRDIKSGLVKMVTGISYMLEAHEELWDKELSNEVSLLLQNEGTYHVDNPPKLVNPRIKSKVVTFTIPHNSVAQVFDFKEKKNEIVFGPQLIKLHPYEQITVLDFSGDNPKKEEKIKSLIMRLGPDFISDTVEVETSDHAKLLLKLTYSWEFKFDRSSKEQVEKIFQVKDFVGDCCKAIASRIRGIVSGASFDDFHRESSNIVQVGVFGKNQDGTLKKPLKFKSNFLEISNVDIQSQEPVDAKTREILNESMKLSMSTNIKIKEAEAKHSEDKANQEAKGKVERKQIEDETEIEDKKLILLELEAKNKSIRIIGESESIAKSKAEENEITSSAELEKAKNSFEAEKIKKLLEIEKKEKLFKEEIKHLKRMSDLEIEKAQTICNSTIEKIETMVKAIGKETLVELARAGPETQAKILKSLGVKSFLITDGKNPINLFNTSNGLMGGAPIEAFK